MVSPRWLGNVYCTLQGNLNKDKLTYPIIIYRHQSINKQNKNLKKLTW